MKIVIVFLAVMALSLTRINEISRKDKAFIMSAASAGIMEVKLSELAESNGTSATVEILGEQMVTDHSKANAELLSLARKKGIITPTNLDEKQQKCYRNLMAKKGEEFDKAYAKFMLKDHKVAVSEFRNEVQNGEDPEIINWAANTLPTLEHHKIMSEEACKALSKEK